MEQLTEIIRNFIATIWQGSCAAILSRLGGLRSPDDKTSPSDNDLTMVKIPHRLVETLENHSVCEGCGQKLKPTGPVVLVLGAPGVGKGTQCAFLAQEFGFRQISYGDLCRGLKNDKSSIVSRLDTKVGSSNPDVPDDLGAWLMWKEIRTAPGRRWLLDGFPKRVKHLEEFLKLMPDPLLTLIFECPQDVSLQRVAKRGKMAGEQARREDLNEMISRKRINDSNRNMTEILQTLQDRRMKFLYVNTNRTEDLIRAELRQIMSENGFAR